jgi:hypothetical protein
VGYFSNGTEGLMYQEAYCFRCQNWGKDKLSESSGQPGCPVWDAHLFYAYEECNSKSNAKMILDMLIPLVDHTFKDGITHKINGECSMFRPVIGHEIPGQLELTDASS